MLAKKGLAVSGELRPADEVLWRVKMSADLGAAELNGRNVGDVVSVSVRAIAAHVYLLYS